MSLPAFFVLFLSEPCFVICCVSLCFVFHRHFQCGATLGLTPALWAPYYVSSRDAFGHWMQFLVPQNHCSMRGELGVLGY